MKLKEIFNNYFFTYNWF